MCGKGVCGDSESAPLFGRGLCFQLRDVVFSPDCAGAGVEARVMQKCCRPGDNTDHSSCLVWGGGDGSGRNGCDHLGSLVDMI